MLAETLLFVTNTGVISNTASTLILPGSSTSTTVIETQLHARRHWSKHEILNEYCQRKPHQSRLIAILSARISSLGPRKDNENMTIREI
jgi:hypothetical protein